MLGCVEPGFNIVEFLKMGTFRTEDVEYLERIANGSETVPHFTQVQCMNFLEREDDNSTNEWLIEGSMDAFILLLQRKYPTVKFITSLRWKSRIQYFIKEITDELKSSNPRQYFGVLLCEHDHWFWVIYNVSLFSNIIYYGDNMNIPQDSKEDISDQLIQMGKLLSDCFGILGNSPPDIQIVKLKSPHFNDSKNCGTFAACSLMLFMESRCSPSVFQEYVNKDILNLTKIKFLRYKLAMCIALQTLVVSVMSFEPLFENDAIQAQLPLPDILSVPLFTELELGDQFTMPSVTSVADEKALAAWPPCVKFSDLTPPMGDDRTETIILFLIAGKAGIHIDELEKQAFRFGIAARVVNGYLNKKLRLDANNRETPNGLRVVRRQGKVWFATENCVHNFSIAGWSFSRFDEIKLKRKTNRLLSPKKTVLLLESAEQKKKRPYVSMEMEESWATFVQRLTQEYPRPLTTTDMKLSCAHKKCYPETLGKLQPQTLTLRLIQGILAKKTDTASKASKRGRSRKAELEDDGDSDNSILKIPYDIAVICTFEMMKEVIASMSLGCRTYCAEFVASLQNRNPPMIIDGFVEVYYTGNMKKLLQTEFDPNNANMITQTLDYLHSIAAEEAGRLAIGEFLLRAAILDLSECFDHLKKLLFFDEKMKIELVDKPHIIGRRKRDGKSKASKGAKSNPTNNCIRFLIPLRFLLYSSQTVSFATENVLFSEIDMLDPVQKRLVVPAKRLHNLFHLDSEAYCILDEPIYYGTLFETPNTREYRNWVNENLRKGLNGTTSVREQYVTIAGIQYFECRANLRVGDRFFIAV